MSKGFRLVILSVVFGGVLVGVSACHRNEKVQAAPDPVLSQNDKNFIIQAEEDNIQEGAMGRLAKENSRNKAIKNYADTLVKDQSDALQKLTDIMQKYGVKQPTAPSGDRPQEVAQLKGLSRRAFDRKFVNLVVQDHEKAIATFQREANSAEDGDVRHYAINMLPTIDNHLKKAQELETRMAKSVRK
jgi:putative membrane protein